MAYAYYLRNLRRRYYDCWWGARKTADQLYTSMGTLRSMISIQQSCYKVDDVGGGGNYLNYLYEKQLGIYNNIVNNILPWTYNKINSLDYQIVEEESAE